MQELQIHQGDHILRKSDPSKNQSNGRPSRYLQNIDAVIVHSCIDQPSNVVLEAKLTNNL